MDASGWLMIFETPPPQVKSDSKPKERPESVSGVFQLQIKPTFTS